MKISLQLVQESLSILQTLAVLVAAIVGAIKFKIFGMWKHAYRTEMECHHFIVSSGETVFIAEYSIYNTGERPISIDRVQLQLCRAAAIHGGHLVPDRASDILMPTAFTCDDLGPDKHFKPIGSLGEIKKEERSIFTLRCSLRDLPDVFFVIGEFHWKRSMFQPDRKPSFYSSMYIKTPADNVPQKTLAQSAGAR